MQIKVIYPKYVVPISSTLKWDSKKDSLLTFNIGTLKAGESKRFVITDSVMCGNESIRGLTQCTKAIISPASSCIQQNAAWDKASIEVDGYCEGDYANFTIKNVGTGSMKDSTNYRIFFDMVLVQEKKVKLQAGETLPLLIFGKGRAIRLETDQVPNHPTESEPSTTVEACGRSQIASRVENAVMRLPQDNKSEHSQTSCMEIRDSYDPNDKQVAPIGVTEKKFIKNTDLLEYMVRFQNTGSDTAYTVVVRDTLSKFLDISSLVVGASSHSYIWSISGKGNPIITFTFNNINLPHAKVNEAGSNGFIRFKIRQIAANPIGTKITNKAGIYFDFNSPIITNETLNEIGEPIVKQLGRVENLADIIACDGKTLPTTAQVGKDLSIEVIDKANLSANKPEKGTGIWKLISGSGKITEPNNPNSTVTNLAYGDNIFEWQISLCGKTSAAKMKITRQNLVANVSIKGDTLTANEGESYQWFLNGNPIPNATKRSFIATESGNYSVAVTKLGVTVTSVVSTHKITAYQEDLFSQSIKVYPNPSTSEAQIEMNFIQKGKLKLSLYDYVGKLVYSENIEKKSNTETFILKTNDLATGFYWVEIQIGNVVGRKKLVKQ